jgi:mRNA-degrading endonuclease toxin of MazEF toxin-antitoxin module
VVLSADGWNASQSDVVLAAITSQIPAILEAGSIAIASADLLAGGLPKPSRVRTTKLFTMHQGLLKRTLGRLPDATTAAVLAEVRRFFS